MGLVDQSYEAEAEEVIDSSGKRRVVPMDDAFRAFQIISQTADLDYIKKLSKLLSGVAIAMGE